MISRHIQMQKNSVQTLHRHRATLKRETVPSSLNTNLRNLHTAVRNQLSGYCCR